MRSKLRAQGLYPSRCTHPYDLLIIDPKPIQIINSAYDFGAVSRQGFPRILSACFVDKARRDLPLVLSSLASKAHRAHHRFQDGLGKRGILVTFSLFRNQKRAIYRICRTFTQIDALRYDENVRFADSAEHSHKSTL